jgi:hypothetical protein
MDLDQPEDATMVREARPEFIARVVSGDTREFFQEHSDLVTKKKMDLKQFEAEQARLLKDPEIMKPWLDYHSRYNHLRAYFRTAREYEHQVPVIDGKRHGKDVNLYKLFTERCLQVLREGGKCGLVVPSGIYTDLGAKKLREMLFARARITGLFGFENRKGIFEGVHRSFKFVVLTFERGGPTDRFPAAFMRLDLSDLEQFPDSGGMEISTELIGRVSPDSLSIMEFKSELDIKIAEMMMRFPLLRDSDESTWNVELHREFNMTDDAHLFSDKRTRGSLPLYEGKMIHQFTHQLTGARYWIDERKGRAALLGREADEGQRICYQRYRIAFRDVARNTDERTMIASVLPRCVFSGNTLVTSEQPREASYIAYLTAVLNSFVFDYLIRQRVTAHCNMFMFIRCLCRGYAHTIPGSVLS